MGRYYFFNGFRPLYGWLAGLSFFLMLAFFAERVLFALAAYHDARAKGNPNALLWALLIGFVGWIPGIIYLCLRAVPRGVIRCPSCGVWHPASDLYCPNCGEPTRPASQYADPATRRLAGQAKAELIAGIVCFAAAFVMVIIRSLAFFLPIF